VGSSFVVGLTGRERLQMTKPTLVVAPPDTGKT